METLGCILSPCQFKSNSSSSAQPLQKFDEIESSTTDAAYVSDPLDRSKDICMDTEENASSKENNRKIRKRRNGSGKSKTSFSSTALSSLSLQNRRIHAPLRRKNASGSRRRRTEIDLPTLAFPLGMSFAAVVDQILRRKVKHEEKISEETLLVMCTSAVKESVLNVFDDGFDSFLMNFERSFCSTMKTLQLINDIYHEKLEDHLSSLDNQNHVLEIPSFSHTQDQPSVEGKRISSSLACLEPSEGIAEIQRNDEAGPSNHQLILCGQQNRQLAFLSRSKSPSSFNEDILNTFERSVIEQTRSNDLKQFEISLTMKKLQLKQSQLMLGSMANLMERFKISMGISKASFKAEKLKTQLEDARHTELLKKCIDCLIAGLLIMSACILHGAYNYSFQKIMEMTSTCASLHKESKSTWWIPNPVSSFSSVFQTIKCHAVVASRMFFGLLLIMTIAYSLVQRSAVSQQTMPITFILLILGVVCGFAGKFCVDTLGGNGYLWLLYWEALCLLHFFAHAFTPTLFTILHGPVSISSEFMNTKFPYWIRRVIFYSFLLFFLPVLCGLMPFASLNEWARHFAGCMPPFF